jgi:hypothetical protein
MAAAKSPLSYSHSSSCEISWLRGKGNKPVRAGYFNLAQEAKVRLATDRYAKFRFSRRQKEDRWESVRQLIESAAAPETALIQRFNQLAKRWREETRTVSSTTDRAMHGAYQDIIGMGRPVVPFILREMAVNGGHWFWALRHITHENPVSPQDAGNIPRMREAWLQWGREQRYL